MALERWEKLGISQVCWGETMCLEEINTSNNLWAEHQPSLLRLIWRSAPERIPGSGKLENPNILKPYLNTALKGAFLVFILDAFCSFYEQPFYAVHSQSDLYWSSWWPDEAHQPCRPSRESSCLPSAGALQQTKSKSEGLLDDCPLYHFFVSVKGKAS